ncbi:hypothetical protein N7466_009918 [Penicillium verhagenii]|uniref:uncharacterized protein n=1 Tax=Penicillium verhagenii TaxID=1562060 RepID=UPI002544F9EA|nr:uncharacterized protein N7466_009918 [Penicillium verhagenii]KAJ5918975.1 hypothetical protein N7466_009918 [Penicillium verhagenii]
MSNESSDNPRRTWDTHFHPPPQQETSTESWSSLLPPARLPRGRFDLRRPVSPVSAPVPENEVIDLTNDSELPRQLYEPRSPNAQGFHTVRRRRPPRFGRAILSQEVVDLVDEPATPVVPLPGERRHGEWGHNSSPDVQFVGSVQRDAGSLPQRGLWNGRLSENNNRWPAFGAHGMSLTREMISRSLYLPPWPAERNPYSPGPDMNFLMSLDYASTSFNLRQPTEQTPVTRRPAHPTLSPAPKGFKRTLEDDDAAACPNCYGELGVGGGKKEEIWVAKPCGHVYCGECASNRSKSKARKTNSSVKSKTFSKCQVADCEKSLSAPSAMFHLYL